MIIILANIVLANKTFLKRSNSVRLQVSYQRYEWCLEHGKFNRCYLYYKSNNILGRGKLLKIGKQGLQLVHYAIYFLKKNSMQTHLIG